MISSPDGLPLVGVTVQLTRATSAFLPRSPTSLTAADGIFRLLGIPPGAYDVVFSAPGFPGFRQSSVQFNAGEVVSIEVRLAGVPSQTGQAALPQQPREPEVVSSYRELSRRPDSEGAIVPPAELTLPPDADVYVPHPYRWDLGTPDYRRYPGGSIGNDEAMFVRGHWYDPFNRNMLKGDTPIFGNETFFSFTGSSITAMDGRRLPTPSGQSSAEPGETQFFGNPGQFFLDQTFRASFDLFHGDTTAFRPVDWQFRVTPAASINYLLTQENGIVSPNVLKGTTRLDGWAGLQEAFGEYKIKDLSPNYDFVSIRAGIQSFSSDFRGFIFADEQPGVRIFGNYDSNRIQYNLAAFDLLEKNTNSGLNTFHRRGRDVAVANVYIQDAGVKGYTTEFSYVFSKDNASIHYDDNGFIVRPAPIGTVTPHEIESHYIGWTGDGHIGRFNIDHAFYQALGYDTLNQIADRRTHINAQLAAVELSRDEDWLRWRVSVLYASGDDNPRDGTARGFDSVVDAESFAGGPFSFFNREGIRLTGTGVALTSPDSFLPDLRSSKDEGQSNFVNPGLLLYNAGVDAKVLSTLKLIGNVSFLQFARTQPLVFLEQQAGIRRTIGVDSSLGFIYRPLLNDNIVFIGGLAVLPPGPGLRDIYNSQTMLSGFVTLRFQF